MNCSRVTAAAADSQASPAVALRLTGRELSYIISRISEVARSSLWVATVSAIRVAGVRVPTRTALVVSTGGASMRSAGVVTLPTGEALEYRAGSAYPPGTDAFFRRWVACTIAGEAAGFTVAAALAATQDLTQMPEFAVLLGAGALEGALLGRGQAMAMSRLQLPQAVLRLWPVATSVAAVVAWSIGLIPGSLHRLAWTSWSAWLLAAVLILVLLASVPTAQFMLLRTALPTAGRWVRFNAVAWMLGLSWTFVPVALVKPNTPVVSEIGVYAIAGILMATTVAIVTGLCWLSWLKRGNLRTAIADAPE
jgi:hypothetical protein